MAVVDPIKVTFTRFVSPRQSFVAFCRTRTVWNYDENKHFRALAPRLFGFVNLAGPVETRPHLGYHAELSRSNVVGVRRKQ